MRKKSLQSAIHLPNHKRSGSFLARSRKKLIIVFRRRGKKVTTAIIFID